MGYGFYTWADRLDHPALWRLRKVLAAVLRARGARWSRKAADVFSAPSKRGLRGHIFSQEQGFFSGREIEKMTGLPYSAPDAGGGFARVLTAAEEQAFFDLTHYLKDDLLVKVDRSSMRHGLEVRVPFLDHRLVEYSLNIAPGLKRKDGESKYLIKKIMERYYPKELIYRKKWGFSVPLEEWLRDSDIISAPKGLDANYQAVIDELTKRYSQDEKYGYLYNRIYVLWALGDES